MATNEFYSLAELIYSKRKVTVLMRREHAQPLTGVIVNLDGAADMLEQNSTPGANAAYNTAGVTGFRLRLAQSLQSRDVIDVWVNLDAVEQIRPFNVTNGEKQSAEGEDGRP